MKDLASLVVRQFRVFEPDVIPAAALLTGPGREVFRAQFNFREIVIPENAPGDLHFAGGMLITPGNDNPIIINYAQINPQRIILDVAGDTATTYIIYEAISAAIAQLDPRSRLRESEPLLLTHETQCVARLSIKWQDLVSDRLAHFLESESVVNIKSGPAASRIASMTLRFVIQFDPSDKRLREYGVIHADKTLVIEPRQNTPLSEQLYFLQSPLDSASHLKLVEEFERSVSGAKRKR